MKLKDKKEQLLKKLSKSDNKFLKSIGKFLYLRKMS